MDREGFRQLLQERKLSEEQIERQISLAERFEGFLKESGPQGLDIPPTRADLQAFSALLIEEKLNTYENYLALVRYGYFTKNNEVYIAAVELIDGSEVLGNLYEKLGQEIGEQKRDQVFAGIELPPLGTPPSQKPRITHAVMERLESLVDPETCKRILSPSLRDLRDEYYLDGKEKYLESKNIDEYLARKGEEFIAQLEQLKNDGRLFFTQEVTDEVIEFVRDTPEISQGVREGDILYEVKIPYMTKEYLAETDERMKRYYYCHCPWVRESIKEGDVSVSPTFCQCSAGFVKKPWEVIFGRTLEAEVVESVLQGDLWCKIAIHLPEEALQNVDAAG